MRVAGQRGSTLLGSQLVWPAGYGHTNAIGDYEVPAAAGDVDVGGTVVQQAAAGNQTCALLSNGAMRCWGYNWYGQLGYGHAVNIGDDELPSAVGDVHLDGVALQIAVGYEHTCARFDTGALRCWGYNNSGQLGYGHVKNIGVLPITAAGDVPYQ